MVFGTMFPHKYRHVYFKEYRKFPYQLLTGRNILLYTGQLLQYDDNVEYDSTKDYIFDCKCKYPLWRELKRLV